MDFDLGMNQTVVWTLKNTKRVQVEKIQEDVGVRVRGTSETMNILQEWNTGEIQ